MKSAKRQARRLPLPEGPTLELKLDDGQSIILDRFDLLDVGIGVPGVTPRANYAGFGYLVTITRSLHAEHGQLLHVVVSHGSGKLPPWYVLKAVKQAIFPENVGAMLPLPEASAYVNLTEALHLIQMPSDWVGL